MFWNLNKRIREVQEAQAKVLGELVVQQQRNTNAIMALLLVIDQHPELSEALKEVIENNQPNGSAN